MRIDDKKYLSADKKNLYNKKFGRWKVLGRERVILKEENSQKRTCWLCKCECGTERMVREDSLLDGTSKSCGCLHKDGMRERNLKSYGESAANDVFVSYKNHAKERGFSFELTKNQAICIMSENCYYCGISPSNVSKSNHNSGDFVYNGIDRIDNSKGYTIENCVPCCKKCNGAKSKMSKSEFLDWIETVYLYQHKREIEKT